MNYILHLLIMINIYIILALSLNQIIGFTGMFSLAHAAFYGLGAYAYTLLIMNLNFSFFPAFILAIIIVGFITYLITFPLLKLKGDPFIIGTLGFQIIVFTLLYNWTPLTRGPYGIPGIPKPVLFGLKIDSLLSFFIFSFIIMILILFFFYRLYKSPFGRVLKGIREDELVISTMGRNVIDFKRTSFVIGASIAAIAGMLFATYVTYIDPTSFTLDESIFIVSILLIGGSGNLKGSIIGVVIMILLPEALRFVGIPDSVAANVRQIIYGLLLILIMRFRPQGIFGEYGINK